MRTQSPIRTLFALTVLTCLVALLVLPGATTMVLVNTQSTGKQMVRVVSAVTLVALAATAYLGLLHAPDTSFHVARQVYLHGFGPELIDKTCVRLC